MQVMHPVCCGIDVHQKSIVCCILDGPLTSNEPKKYQTTFGTTTKELKAALDWILEHQVTHVFFESTGQYWIPLFNIFSDSDLELVLAILNILKMSLVVKQTSKMLSGLLNLVAVG